MQILILSFIVSSLAFAMPGKESKMPDNGGIGPIVLTYKENKTGTPGGVGPAQHPGGWETSGSNHQTQGSQGSLHYHARQASESAHINSRGEAIAGQSLVMVQRLDGTFRENMLDRGYRSITEADAWIKDAEVAYNYSYSKMPADLPKNCPAYEKRESAKNAIEAAKTIRNNMQRDYDAFREKEYKTFLANAAVQAKQFGKTAQSKYEAAKEKMKAASDAKIYKDSIKLVQTNVIATNNNTRSLLSSASISAVIEQRANTYINNQLAYSESLAQNAVDMSQQGASKSAIQLVSQLATDLSQASYDAVNGIGKGVYKSFQNATDAAKAIYDNPAILANLSTNIMNTITDPTAFLSAAKKEVEHLWNVVAYGSAEEKGIALGEFTGNVVLGLATGEASAVAKTALTDMSKLLTAAKPVKLGEKLADAIAKAPSLVPEITKIEHAVKQLDIDSMGAVKGWRADHKIIEILDANTFNQPFVSKGWDPPAEPGTKLIRFQTIKPDVYARLHTDTNQKGPWLIKREAVEGLSPAELQIKYCLKSPPTHITDVTVPADWNMSRSKINDILAKITNDPTRKSNSGAVQYYSEKHLPDSSFGPAVPIGDKVK